MKSITEINSHLESLTERFGFNLAEYDQNSPEWYIGKFGVFSASKADCLLAGKSTPKRKIYILSKVAEVCTGSSPNVQCKQMEWGHDNEGPARSMYEFFTENNVKEVPIIYKTYSELEGPDIRNLRASCSPDGYGTKKGLEIKNPYTTQVYLDFLTNECVKPEWKKQVQFSMWVTDAEVWDFAEADKRMKLKPFHHIEIERDEKMMKLFDEAVPEAIHDMDKILESIGIKFGDHWETIKNERYNSE